jgi:DNA-binding NtrC family response regulator
MLPSHLDTVHAQDVAGWLYRQPADGTNGHAPSAPESLNLRAVEAWAIRTAIQRAGGNKSRAARILGISRDTLHRKLGALEPRRPAARDPGAVSSADYTDCILTT